MKRLPLVALALSALVSIGTSDTVRAFCGFYVAKADASLFNEASQVVLVRDGKRTVITMVNDFKGDPKEFAVVIPVPSFIEKEQIHVAEMALVDHLDALYGTSAAHAVGGSRAFAGWPRQSRGDGG